LIALFIPALGLAKGTTSNGAFLLLSAVVVPLSVSAGYLSHRYLEEPFRRWVRRTPQTPPVDVVRPVALAGSRA
jgi:peptidoglycan/LPS O-acetylase OafA/YrhL